MGWGIELSRFRAAALRDVTENENLLGYRPRVLRKSFDLPEFMPNEAGESLLERSQRLWLQQCCRNAANKRFFQRKNAKNLKKKLVQVRNQLQFSIDTIE